MYNQVQGTYPQLAGSFHNSQGMMPHDNGRTAQQVPTFFGGIQNMVNASSAMGQYQGIPLGQSILTHQAMAANSLSNNYIRTMNRVVGGVGTATSMLTLGAGVAGMAGYGGATGALLGGPLGLIGGMAIGGIVSGYKRKMQDVEDMRQLAMQGNFGRGLTDPVTGQLSHTAAFDLSGGLRTSAKGLGVKFSEMKNLTGMASNLGMLSGTNSITEVTRKITDLAKASKEIMMLGQGISMSDAMQLQKLTQDMGISTAKFQGMSLGRNLVSAARAARMTTQQAAQLGGQGAATFAQLGLGPAAGMNAAFHSNTAALALVNSGSVSQRELTALGGQAGLGRALLGGQASTLGRLSDTLVMGAVKMDADGSMRIDRELLDQYTRGQVTRKQLIERGRNIGQNLSKADRGRVLEQLHYQMPQLRQEMSDSLETEEVMQIQANEIRALQERTGISTRQAIDTYFQDPQQAAAFRQYANNFRKIRAETRKQGRLTAQEEMLRYAGMAKSNTYFSRMGRSITDSISGVIDDVTTPFTEMGERLAGNVLAAGDTFQIGARRMFAHEDVATGPDYLIDAGRILERGGSRGKEQATGFGSYTEALTELGADAFKRRFHGDDEMNFLGGGGISERMEEAQGGQMNPFTKLFRGHYFGFDGGFFRSEEDQLGMLMEQANLADQVNVMSNLMGEKSKFNITNSKQREKYTKVLSHLRSMGTRRAKGEHVRIDEFTPERIAKTLNLSLKSSEDRAVIGAALDYATTKDQGQSRQGLSELQRTLQGVAIQKDLLSGGETTRDRDTLDIGGGIFKAEGLDRALLQSGIGADDLTRIISVLNTAGHALIPGSGQFNTRQILATAGVDSKNIDMSKAKDLIQVLNKGMVTSGDKSVGLKDATDIGAITINARQLKNARSEEEQRQLDAMNKELRYTLGEGGEKLIDALSERFQDPRKRVERRLRQEKSKEILQDLKDIDIMDYQDLVDEDGGEGLQAFIDRGLKDLQSIGQNASFGLQAARQLSRYKAQVEDVNKSKINALIAKRKRDGGLSSADQEELQVRLHGTGADKAKQSYTRIDLKEVLRQEDRRRKKRGVKLSPEQEQEIREGVDKATEEVTDVFSRGTNLSSILDEIAQSGALGDKGKEVIERLKQSPEYAGLQAEYTMSSADVRADPNKAQEKKADLLNKIIAAGRGMSAKNRQKGESEGLKGSLDLIATGLKNFNDHLSKIAIEAAKAEGVNIKLTAST